MLPLIRLGESDFLLLKEKNSLFVDKSLFISEILRRGSKVQLYPRPRRFGKTTNLSMLRYFLEHGPDLSEAFADLQVWQDRDAKEHFQKYPVITLSFKDAKHTTWAKSCLVLEDALVAEVRRHRATLQSESVDSGLKNQLLAVADKKEPPTSLLLKELSLALHQATGMRVALLIDEYDAAILSAWQYDYYEEAIAWFRSLLTAGLKDNASLFKGVLTGVLRVARESMFSGLNNIEVFSLLRENTTELFGFTQAEIEKLLALAKRSSELEAVQHWYNGYRFGGETVYNPWSILNFLSNPGVPCEPYWLGTSDNALARALLLARAELSHDVEQFLKGGQLEQEIDEQLNLKELHYDAIWSLLLFSGYLTYVSLRKERGRSYATLAIPNAEVQILWEDTFTDWLKAGIGRLEPLHQALLSGDTVKLEVLLTRLILLHVSSHDVKEPQAESFYHAFVLGLLISLEKSHAVRSNREEGLGRSDIRILPKKPGQPGVILEFKAEEGRKLETLALEALAQIKEKQYSLELEEAGANPIYMFGIAFSGKKMRVLRG